MSSEEFRYIVPFGIAFVSWVFYKLQIEASIRDVKSGQDKRLDDLTSKVNDQSTTLMKVTQVLQQRNPQNTPQRPPLTPQQAGNANVKPPATPSANGPSATPTYKISVPNKRLGDLIGRRREKSEMTKIIDILKNKSKYSAIGATIPKGTIIWGNTGVGMGHMARIIAGEVNLPLIEGSDDQFSKVLIILFALESYSLYLQLGTGPDRIKELFKVAREKKPCILYLDELRESGCKWTRNFNPQGPKSHGGSLFDQIFRLE